MSDYAGTTRDVVEGAFTYNGQDFQVLDTAGIRRKAKVKEDVEYYSVNRAINKYVKELFDENGIEIPFEQVVVHNGNDHN